MTNVKDFIRKYQNIIVLALALGVIFLYVVPVDQVLAQSPIRTQINSTFDNARDTIHRALDDSDRAFMRIEILDNQQAALNDRIP
jgi:hypothetical protein